MNGIVVKVDTFTANHYGENIIYDAIQRDEYVKKVSNQASKIFLLFSVFENGQYHEI